MAASVFHHNPFPGIRSYEIKESHLFFGREKQVKELIVKLRETRFLAIVGSSGCGKSSLIKAGLIPGLLKSNPDTKNLVWELSLFRPGDDPIGNLASALSADHFEYEQLSLKLRTGETGLTDTLNKFHQLGKARLIVIDQFEELFRFRKAHTSGSMGESSAFVEMILHAVRQESVPVYVILSMRTDFLDDCTEFRGLSEMINQGYYLVPRMTNPERRAAITGPVRASGHQISDSLVDRLLEDVGDDPDQLPILQHALMRTWDHWMITRSGDQPIDAIHYEAIGTMKNALSVHLEEIYAGLKNSQSRYDAEKLFKALTDITKENRGTRRPIRLGEICTLINAREEEITDVIDSFRKPGCAFLMPASHVRLNSESTIDISHESIMRVWGRLRKWVEEESESAQLYLRLSKSAELYQQGKSGLWVNPELQLALQWKEQTRPNATWAVRYDPAFERAMTFLDYSKKHYDLEIARKENQQKRNLRRARNSAVFLGIASLVSILFLVISLNLRFKAEASRKEAIEKEKLAVLESRKAEEQRKEAVLQKKISEQQQKIAEQQEMISEQQRQYAVRQQIIAQEQRAVAVDQRRQADISRQEAILSRDEAQNQRREALVQKQIADQERIKAEESERTARRLRLLATSRSLAVQAQQWSASAGNDLAAILALTAFDLNRENGGYENDAAIYSALSAISRDPVKLRAHTDGVRDAVVSPDGQWLYSCGDDGRLLRWSLSDLQKTPLAAIMPVNFSEPLRSVTLSADGNWLLAGTAGGNILAWKGADLQLSPLVLQAHARVVNHLAADPSSNRIYSCGTDGRVIVWTREGSGFRSSLLDSIPANIRCLAVSPSGQLIYYGSDDGKVRLMDISRTVSEPVVLMSLASPVLSLALNADGTTLAAGLQNGTIHTLSPVKPSGDQEILQGRHASGITGLAFNPVAQTLVSSGYDWTVRVSFYPLRDDRQMSLENHDLWVYGICYTTDANRLISYSADKTLSVVSVRSNDMAERVRKSIRRNLTKEEWIQFLGEDIPYRKVIPDLP